MIVCSNERFVLVIGKPQMIWKFVMDISEAFENIQCLEIGLSVLSRIISELQIRSQMINPILPHTPLLGLWPAVPDKIALLIAGIIPIHRSGRLIGIWKIGNLLLHFQEAG